MQSINPNQGGQGPAAKPTLFQEFKRDLSHFYHAFPQWRTFNRAMDFLLGLMLATGRKTCTASLNWRNLIIDESADLRVFSRSDWDVNNLFAVVIGRVLKFLAPGEPMVVGLDDTAERKWGKSLHNARFVHNPLSEKWLKQRIMWGVRFLHFSAILPFMYAAGRPYAIPISFLPKPAAKKPRRGKLTDEELAEFQAKKKTTLLTKYAKEGIESLRNLLNDLGETSRRLLIVVDGSFMNGPVVAKVIKGVDVIGRVRGNARLYEKALVRVRNTFYGAQLPTPEEIANDPHRRWKTIKAWWGGNIRGIQIKVLNEVYWKEGTRKRPMRLIVVKGTPYKRKGKKRRKVANIKIKGVPRRKTAYLLTTDLTTDPEKMVQHAFVRWQLEQVHRDLKNGLGIGHPQTYSQKSEDRLPSAMVAMYSLWSLAVLRRFGPCWSQEAVPVRPRTLNRIKRLKESGQRYERRFTHQDLIRLLRNEVELADYFRSDGRLAGAPTNYTLPARMSFTA